jgi:acyl carrier protein
MTSSNYTPVGDDEFDRLVEQSSIGTPEARAVSRGVAPERVHELVRLLTEADDDVDEELADMVIADMDDELADVDLGDAIGHGIDVGGTICDLSSIWFGSDGVVTVKSWGDRVEKERVDELTNAFIFDGHLCTNLITTPVAAESGARRAPDNDAGSTASPGVTEEEVLEHVLEEDRLEVARLAERIRRHAVDRQLFEVVRAEGFAGQRWERLVEDLARYGVTVMSSWMRSGYVFAKVNKIGRPLTHSPAELLELSCDRSLREELSACTVAAALQVFERATVAGTSWDPEDGASLSTFFVGGCVYAFNDEFRRWSRHEQRQGNHWRVFAEPVHVAGDVELWREVLGNLAVVIEDVTGFPAARVVPELRFVEDLGMDSINAIEIGVHIEDVYNVRVPSAILPGLHTVAEAVDYITAQCRWPAVDSPLLPPSRSALGSQRRKTPNPRV